MQFRLQGAFKENGSYKIALKDIYLISFIEEGLRIILTKDALRGLVPVFSFACRGKDMIHKGTNKCKFNFLGFRCEYTIMVVS